MSQATTSTAASAIQQSPEASAKETIISMIISLAMALVAKSFVVEAFVIPTGSMAPTLLGQHMLFRSPQSGYEWAVNPYYYFDPGTGQLPKPIQGNILSNEPNPEVTDPMSTSQDNGWTGGRPPIHTQAAGYVPPPVPKPARAGDRILVEKWLYEIFPPKRYDVVVFKNPEDPSVNYIKRLIGLPGEQIWLADGDVFARTADERAKGVQNASKGWEIQRKPVRIQRSLWRPIYSSEYAPLQPIDPVTKREWFTPPWNGDKWSTGAARSYRCDVDSATRLQWDTPRWPLWDLVPYNDVITTHADKGKYPVSDLRIRAGVKPDNAGLSMSVTITARSHQFSASIDGKDIVLRMREQRPDAPWDEMARAASPGLPAGAVTNIEFWHYDQSMHIFINDREVVSAQYDWNPSERLQFVTGMAGEDYSHKNGDWQHDNRLGTPSNYEPGADGRHDATKPGVEMSFIGSPVTLYNIGLDRDIYYQPTFDPYRNQPAFGTHPDNLVELTPAQFFCCGDNSPSSLDGRLWRTVNPWVTQEIDDTVGVVPRKLLLGKAFFVYFPAPFMLMDKVPIPDFGRMRFIR